jgi:RNase P subunit RPR2
MMAEDLSAPCPKCHTEMTFVTAMSHPNSPEMQRTTFVCYSCNQTRSYALSVEMANAYAATHAPV